MLDFLRYHRHIIGQLLLGAIILIFLYWVAGFLPPGLFLLLRLAITSISIILIFFILIFFSLQIIHNFRFERSFIPKKLRLASFPRLQNYRIVNPLDQPGNFRKAQLHTHSSLSYDSKTSPAEVIASYSRDNYSFLVITDHDRRSDFSTYSSEQCLVIPGSEETVPALFWPIPLGKHLILVNPPVKLPWTASPQGRINETIAAGGIAIPAHLSWRGGAGTGRWYPKELLRLKNLRLVEIDSPHSKDPLDLTIWHKLIAHGGPNNPVWGVSVDDSHRGSSHYGWIMVKTSHLDLQEFIQALNQGAFYATNGPTLAIKMNGTAITVDSPGAEWIRFLNSKNKVIAANRSESATYQSFGDEGFIRVEATASNGKTAWSQPMWLVAQE